MKRLIVLAPGLSGYKGWDQLVERLSNEEALKDAEWCRWHHHKHLLSGGDPNSLARDLSAYIHQQWQARGPFDDVILVGHSIGGMLVRMAYLFGSGEDAVIRQKYEWAAHVSRIILLAGLSRGVDSNRFFVFRVDNWIERFIPRRFRRLSSHLYRGSATITNLRIQWIRYMASLGQNAPVVVQLIGTRDELVTRDDSVDIEQSATGYYISIPEAGHDDLHRLDKASEPNGRYALLRDAFVHSRPEHGENADISGPSQIVFVLHGIRADNRTWVEDTVNEIQAKWPGVYAVGLRYPYFTALQFALPQRRRKNLRWFQDVYTEALARNPSARFNFIGHSNGTYLFGESLRDIPGMRFERAALVGCVLPQTYPWDELVQRGQISSIRVDGSARDVPVAVLCSGLRGVGMRDVGTAGVVGFTNLTDPKRKHEFFWYDGGHSAPLEKGNIPALARFAVAGEIVPPTMLVKESYTLAVGSRLAKIMTPVLLTAVAASAAYLLVVFPLLPTLIGISMVLGTIIVVMDVM